MFAKAAYPTASRGERPYLLNQWANAILAIDRALVPEALSLYREALQLKPDYWIAYNNVINAEWALGEEEEVEEDRVAGQTSGLLDGPGVGRRHIEQAAQRARRGFVVGHGAIPLASRNARSL